MSRTIVAVEQPSDPSIASRRRLSPGLRDFLLGLPALLTLVFVILLAVKAQAINRVELIDRYRIDGEEELNAKNFEAAAICYERLERLGDDRPQVHFNRAMVLDALGEKKKAMESLRKAAPEDGPGSSRAHLILAMLMLEQPERFPEVMRVAESHLRTHLRDEPLSLDGNSLLGQLLAATGRPAEARPLLALAASVRPELLITLAQACRDSDNKASAREWAGRASRIYREKSESDPDDRSACLKWAEAELFLENFPVAVSILERGLARNDDRPLHVALATVFASWLDFLKGKDKDLPIEDELKLLEKALKHDPMNQALLGRLATTMSAGGRRAEWGRTYLLGLLAAGKATATVHFLLGADDWERRKSPEALDHWEMAYRLAPETPIIANNLAYVLAFGARPDLPRALAVADQAIARWPDMKILRGTRGHILVKMDRWKEAIPELEASLQLDPKNPALHETLARAYETLKMPEIAAVHRQQAAVTNAASPKSN